MFKTKSPVPFIIATIVVIVICIAVFLATGQTEWSASWTFEF